MTMTIVNRSLDDLRRFDSLVVEQRCSTITPMLIDDLVEDVVSSPSMNSSRDRHSPSSDVHEDEKDFDEEKRFIEEELELIRREREHLLQEQHKSRQQQQPT